MALESTGCCENLPLFDIFRGDDVAKEVVICDTSNGRWSITGWEFIIMIKEKESDSDFESVIYKQIGPMEGINAEQGLFYIELNRGETSKLTKSKYYFILKQSINGLRSTVLAGPVKMRGKVNWSKI